MLTLTPVGPYGLSPVYLAGRAVAMAPHPAYMVITPVRLGSHGYAAALSQSQCSFRRFIRAHPRAHSGRCGRVPIALDECHGTRPSQIGGRYHLFLGCRCHVWLLDCLQFLAARMEAILTTA